MKSITPPEIVVDPKDYKILLVDDVASNILLLKVILQPQEYQLVTASNGTEAIQMAHAEAPDLILLDVMMPDIDGFEVARQLKADPDTWDIPIIFLTALNSPSDIVKGFKVKANDFITKPFNKEELIIRVSHQISLIAARRMILRKTEELRQIIIGRDRMYSVIAHDLRAPMGSIKMVLNMLLTTIESSAIGEDMFEMLTFVNRTTEEVFALLDNLLKWTKSQMGKLKVVYQDANIVDVTHDVFDVFSMVAEMKNIKIEYEAPKEIMVYADVDMMKTIVRNLISNAIKFSEENGVVKITVSEEAESAVVCVKDFGKGIPEGDQSKLLNDTTHFSTFGTNKEEGSGLGLLLCRDFVKQNGGELWFKSKEGEGTEFYFSIPKKGFAAERKDE